LIFPPKAGKSREITSNGVDILPIFGFFDYGKSGKGIAKDAPQKKPFFKFWEIFSRKFWKFFYINALYLFFCLPVVTIGPATVAMSQVMRKFTLEQPIFIFDEFKTSFKRNFKQGFIVGIFDVIFIASFVYAFFHYMGDSDFISLASVSVMVATGSFITMMHFYIYPQIACLSLSLKQIIRNSMILTVYGIKRNIVTLFFTVLIVGAMILFPVSLIALPVIPFAWLNFLMVFNAYPIITKHIITPFYEAKGEKNPEIPDYSADSEEETLFEDFGGREAAIKSKPKPKGKVIK
jgi:uncharacterized membrane protein YesL